MAATQAAKRAEAAPPFEPPFRGRTANEILEELGFPDARPAEIVRRLAHAVETGNYPYMSSLLRREQAEASDDAALAAALAAFRKCADLGEQHEEAHGAGSARNLAHSYWPNIWERNKRLREQGYVLGVDCIKS